MKKLATPDNEATALSSSLYQLPTLATAEQIASPLGVTARTILLWASAGTIPTALRQGRVVRFDPHAVASALGVATEGSVQREAGPSRR